jgi:hypothetical protein
LLVTVHPNAASVVVNDTDPVPPEAGTLADDGLTTSTPPDCVTVKVTNGPLDGFTVIVAVRDVAWGFAAPV